MNVVEVGCEDERRIVLAYDRAERSYVISKQLSRLSNHFDILLIGALVR